MTGMSTAPMDCMNNKPMPGHWNTVSVMMENAMMEPSCRPVMVMTGTSVFFNRSEEHTSELQSLMRISYAVFCLKKKNINKKKTNPHYKSCHKHRHKFNTT